MTLLQSLTSVILDIAMAGTSATLLARKWESALLVNVDNDNGGLNRRPVKALISEPAVRILRHRSVLRERAADLREVQKRLMDHFARQSPFIGPADREGCVLVTSELFSFAAVQLEGRGVRGLIVEQGGFPISIHPLLMSSTVPAILS